MDNDVAVLRERIETLERQVQRGRRLAIAGLLAIGAVWFATTTGEAQDNRVLRVRTLIVQDDGGRDRVVLGAPVPDIKGGGRASPSVGMVINDADGLERFAVGLQQNGRMVMGFDAPPGTGDPRNRERINIVADASGGAYIRFLNRKTFVPGRLVLDDADQFYLEFLDFPDGKAVSRRVSFKGEEKTGPVTPGR